MRSNLIPVLPILLAAIFIIGCSKGSTKVTKVGQTPTSTTPTTYADGADRITIVELQEKIKKNEAFIVDVRDEASYNAGHLPGSKLIPAGQILNHVDELPKDKLIVTYCS